MVHKKVVLGLLRKLRKFNNEFLKNKKVDQFIYIQHSNFHTVITLI